MRKKETSDDKGNAAPPPGTDPDNRNVRCLKCGHTFNLRKKHTCPMKANQLIQILLSDPEAEVFIRSQSTATGMRGLEQTDIVNNLDARYWLILCPANEELKNLEAQLGAALDQCNYAVRVREGAGGENLIASVAVTLQSLTRKLEDSLNQIQRLVAEAE